MNDSLQIIKCKKCGDILTAGEEKFYLNFQYSRKLEPECYQCSQKDIEKQMREVADRYKR